MTEAGEESLSTANLWTETFPDSKQCEVSTCACLLELPRQECVCTTGKRRHFQLSALIYLVSTSSLHFHIIYSTQNGHDNAQALWYFHFINTPPISAPKWGEGRARLQFFSCYDWWLNHWLCSNPVPYPPHLATNVLESCSLVSVLFSGISF